MGRLSGDFRDFFVLFWAPDGSHVVFLCSRVLREGAGPDSGRPGDPSGKNLKTIFNDSLFTLRLDSGLFGPSVSGVGELRVAV